MSGVLTLEDSPYARPLVLHPPHYSLAIDTTRSVFFLHADYALPQAPLGSIVDPVFSLIHVRFLPKPHTDCFNILWINLATYPTFLFAQKTTHTEED